MWQEEPIWDAQLNHSSFIQKTGEFIICPVDWAKAKMQNTVLAYKNTDRWIVSAYFLEQQLSICGL